MVHPIEDTNDLPLQAKRDRTRAKVKRHRDKLKKEQKEIWKLKTTKLKAPPPTSPLRLPFELPPPRFRSPPTVEKEKVIPKNGKKRNAEQERMYCSRSRLKIKMRAVFQELEDTLVQLKDTGFDRQKRGGGEGSNFKWRFQFDVYNHSMRHGSSSGYEKDRTGTRRHNIGSLAIKSIRVRISTREEMLKRLQGTQEQKEFQEAAWVLVEKIVDGVTPLEDWAGEKKDESK